MSGDIGNYGADQLNALKKISVSALTAIRMGMTMRIDAYPYSEEQKKDLRSKLRRGVKLHPGSWMDDIFARVCSELTIEGMNLDMLRSYFFKPFEGSTFQIANEE